MSQDAAGVQIKKWFVLLISIILFLDVVGMVGLFLLRGSINEIALKAQPLIASADEINTSILEARVVLYRYLSEYEDSPARALESLARLQKAAEQGSTLAESADLQATFRKMSEQSQKYSLIIRELPDSRGGVIDWGGINELTTAAREVGDATLALAAEVKTEAERSIEATMVSARNIAAASTFLFLGFLVISVVIVVMMLYWWRKFQEMILDL